MKRPVFTMLIGLPASGKSTYLQTHQRTFKDAVVVSTDAFIEARAAELGMTYNDVWADTCKDAEAHMRRQFSAACDARWDIVVDRTNLTEKSRRRFLSTLSGVYLRVAVVFDVVEDVRLLQASQRVGKDIADVVVDRMRESYTPPTLAEGFDIIVGSYVDTDRWAA